MSYQIVVAFQKDQEFEYGIRDVDLSGLSREAANAWMDAQWIALECEPLNPVGKILLLDRILAVAKYAGAKRFAADQHWGRQYASCVARLLDRPAVRVDVGDMRVG